MNGHVKIWDASSWTLQSELIVSDKGNNAKFSVLAIAPDSKSFIIGDDKGVLHLWSLNGKSEIRAIRSPNGLDRIVHLAFSPDRKTLVAIHGGKRWPAEGTAVVWNTSDWTAHTLSGYTSAAFSRDGRLLALAGPDVKLLDSASGKELRVIDVPALTKDDLPGSEDSPDASEKLPYGVGVSALAFSPDGISLAVGYVEGTVRMMNLNR